MARTTLARFWMFLCCAIFLPSNTLLMGEDIPATTEELADRLVASAFENELRGKNIERSHALEQALLVAPDNPQANWLSGRVCVDGEWLIAHDAAQLLSSDSRISEYRHLRDQLDGNYKAELGLARWCGETGWTGLKQFHYSRLLRYGKLPDAAQKEALRELNLKLFEGRLCNPEEFEQQQRQAKERQEDFERWRTKLVKWRSELRGSNERRAIALQELRAIDDPRAILALEASLYDSNSQLACELIGVLGKFPQFEATQALLRFALLSPARECVEVAAGQLKRRPIHDYYPQLMALLQAPVHSEFRLRSTQGAMRYEHVVAQQGSERNLLAVRDRFYHGVVREAQASPTGIDLYDLTTPIQDFQYEVFKLTTFVNALETQWKVKALNNEIHLKNERVFYLLEQTSPQVFPRNAINWWGWWKDYNDKGQQTPLVCLYDRQEKAYDFFYPIGIRHSCFVAGTKVWTDTGLRPIETLLPGDRVLARNVDTAELQYKVVLMKTLQEPVPVLRLTWEKEEVVVTKSHPFWVNGKGWKMAKELEAGDVLSTVNGFSPLLNVEPLPGLKEVHNLVVQDFNTYFVGETGVLVHDNTYWKPTTAVVPGLPEKVR